MDRPKNSLLRLRNLLTIMDRSIDDARRRRLGLDRLVPVTNPQSASVIQSMRMVAPPTIPQRGSSPMRMKATRIVKD